MRLDVLTLERTGLRVEDAVPLAARKDTGLTPAQLAWVLSQITIGDDAKIPGGLSSADLRSFLSDLIARLVALRHAQMIEVVYVVDTQLSGIPQEKQAALLRVAHKRVARMIAEARTYDDLKTVARKIGYSSQWAWRLHCERNA